MATTLPYADIDSSLRAMAGRAEGFGRFAVGGAHGPVHSVTSLADDGPGSLREACRRQEPLWIVFEISGTIHLSSYLNVSSHKTIDGRGQHIKLSGKGLRLKECENIIICNLEFEGGRGHDVDGIQIKPNSKHIWIDRCSLRDYDDGLIDITRQSTDITVSRCYFANHDKTMLIGADPSHSGDRCIRVTIHHCFFDGTRQRHPRLRFGKVHLYNNYTRNWGVYAICASVEAQIYSQCNIYEAGQKKKAFEFYTEKAADKEEARSGLIISEGDLLLNGAQPCPLRETHGERMFHPSEFYPVWTMEPASDSLKHILHICTGWQSVPRPSETRSKGRLKYTKMAASSDSTDEILKLVVHTKTQKVVFAEGNKKVMDFLSNLPLNPVVGIHDPPSLSSDDVHKDKKLKLSTFEGDGSVNEPTTRYLITDEMVVKPWATMSCVAILEELNVKKISELEERAISFGSTERKRLMEMSFEGKIGPANVLTTLFLTKRRAFPVNPPWNSSSEAS